MALLPTVHILLRSSVTTTSGRPSAPVHSFRPTSPSPASSRTRKITNRACMCAYDSKVARRALRLETIKRVMISAHSHISPVSSSCSRACRTPAPAGRHAPCSASSRTQPPLHPPLHARKYCRTHKLLSIHISTILAEWIHAKVSKRSVTHLSTSLLRHR